MKSKLTMILLFGVAFMNAGCPPAARVCLKGELNFDAPTFILGSTYTTSGPFYNNGSGLYSGIQDFTDLRGRQDFKIGSIENTPPFPFGTGQFIHMNRTVLSFDLTPGTKRVELEYLDQGGTVNVGAGGNTNVYVGSIYTMPFTMVINGVTITKTNVSDILNPLGVKQGEKGVLVFEANSVGGLIIGGEELYLDNICTN